MVPPPSSPKISEDNLPRYLGTREKHYFDTDSKLTDS